MNATMRSLSWKLRILPLAAAVLSAAAPLPAQGSRPGSRRVRAAPPTPSLKPAKKKTKKGEPLAYVGGTLHLGNGTVLRRGTILIRGSKIEAVGSRVELPKGTKVVKVEGRHLCPGFIIVQDSAIGLPRKVKGKYADSYNPFDPQIRRGLAAGITSYLHSSSRGGSTPQAGSALVKLIPRELEDGVILKEPVIHSLTVPLGPKTWKTTRETIEKAKKYLTEKAVYEAAKAAGDAKAAAPKKEKGLEAWLSILQGKTRLRITGCRTVKTIREALEISRLIGRGVLLHGPVEAWILPDEIAATGSAAVMQPRLRIDPLRTREFENGSNIAACRILHDAGVPVAVIPPPGRFGGSGLGLGGLLGRDLNTPFMDACFAERGGLDEEAALATITLDAARCLGVEDRIGSLEPGKDADLLILDGPPLHYKTFVEQAIVNGRVRYDRSMEPFYPRSPRR